MPIVTTEGCDNCGGDGIINGETCSVCNGTGQVPLSTCTHAHTEWNVKYLVDAIDTISERNNVFLSHHILEALDITEHNALTDGEKEGVLLLLSCGRVDLNDGKAGKVRLWNWFGAESTTVANLTALIA